jgi:hypothetical protein
VNQLPLVWCLHHQLPLDGVLAASHDDSKEKSLLNFSRYRGSWRRYFGFALHKERHPTAYYISFIRGVLQPPLTKEIKSFVADAIRPGR